MNCETLSCKESLLLKLEGMRLLVFQEQQVCNYNNSAPCHKLENTTWCRFARGRTTFKMDCWLMSGAFIRRQQRRRSRSHPRWRIKGGEITWRSEILKEKVHNSSALNSNVRRDTCCWYWNDWYTGWWWWCCGHNNNHNLWLLLQTQRQKRDRGREGQANNQQTSVSVQYNI